MKKYIALLALFYCYSCNTKSTESVTTQSEKTEKQGTREVVNASDQEIYSNHRYEYYLEYPADVLLAQAESTNGDGKIFNDKSGIEVLRVYGTGNEDAEGNIVSLKDAFETCLNEDKKKSITYKKSGNSFFVISGMKDGKIYYQKTIQKEDAFATAILQYEAKDSTLYNKISAHIFKSFQFIKDDSTGKYYPNSY